VAAQWRKAHLTRTLLVEQEIRLHGRRSVVSVSDDSKTAGSAALFP
jgi:hypothetical protein